MKFSKYAIDKIIEVSSNNNETASEPLTTNETEQAVTTTSAVNNTTNNNVQQNNIKFVQKVNRTENNVAAHEGDAFKQDINGNNKSLDFKNTPSIREQPKDITIAANKNDRTARIANTQLALSNTVAKQQNATTIQQKQKAPVKMRKFDDNVALRQAIFDNILASANSLQPVSNKKYTLSFSNAHYTGPETYKPKDVKNAILSQESLNRKLQATAILKNEITGEIEERNVTLAKVPYLLDDGTFLRNGTKYTVKHQMRLRPGVFTHVRKNGEFTSQINTDAREGTGHHYNIDPKTGIFYMQLSGTKTPLLPFLKALGVTDSELKEAWGEQVFAANVTKYNPKDIEKYYKKFVRERDQIKTTDPSVMSEGIKAAANKISFDPIVTEQTLGEPIDHYNARAALLTSQKLLKLSQNKVKPDDRDNLAFQEIYGPEDFFEERLVKDTGNVRRSTLNKLTYLQKGLINLPSELLTKQLDDAIMNSGLGQPKEQINNLELLDSNFSVSRMGMGGIPDENTIPMPARHVNLSQRGFIDTIRTPESLRTGVELYMADNAMKGSDRHIYAPFLNAKTGETEYLKPKDVTFKTTAVKSEYDNATDFMPMIKNNELVYAHKSEVEYLVPDFEHTFSPIAHLVPFKQALKGQRLAMGSRMLTQALPLEDGEAPLVQTIIPTNKERSFDEYYGEIAGAIRAKQNARVLESTNDHVTVKYEDGTTQTYDLAEYEPSNRKTYSHQTPVVAVGDIIKKGGLLVKSNQTDNTGSIAVGKNLRTAFIPWKGYNFNDAFVVSESCAKKMKSQHMYQNKIDWLDKMKSGRNQYLSVFPSNYNKDQIAKIGEDGIIKPGSVVNTGDPLVLAINQTDLGVKRLHHKKSKSYTDVSLTWNHHDTGVVTDVLNTKKGAVVLVKSESELKTGDKLSTKFGTKGVVGAILPDDQMPQFKDGQAAEIAIHPGSMISRINPAILLETQLGKIAKKLGHPIKIEDWQNKDLTEYIIELSKKYNVPIGEELIDPETGKSIKNEDGTGIQTGYSYILKLHHTAEYKGSARGFGGYASDESPARGGDEGAKKFGMYDTNALLAHGAVSVIKDARDIRGKRNDDYWMEFMSGRTPRVPRENYKRDKFFNQIKAAGVNIVPEDGKFTVMALTNRDVEQLAGGREVKNSKTINWEKDKKAIPDGLFDYRTFGEYGQKWGQITLNQDIPNPVFEKPMSKLLNITETKFNAVLQGKEQLDNYGTGIKAIQQALNAINVDKEISNTQQLIKQSSGLKRDGAIRRLKYLQGAKDANIPPSEWMLSKIPVLPPRFRPISEMNDGTPLVADANYLYKNIIDLNNSYKEMSQFVDPDEKEGYELYNAYKQIVGLSDPTHPKLKELEVTGLLKHIFGNGNSKMSMVQSDMLGTTVDLVARHTITPDRELDMDSIGVPEESAWKIYKPFIVRKLVKRGHRISEALRFMEDKNELAKQVLMEVMEERPVVVDRAPILHKFGVLAFKPHLTADETMHLNPFVCSGFGADFDGDSTISTINITLSDEFIKNINNIEKNSGVYLSDIKDCRIISENNTCQTDLNKCISSDVTANDNMLVQEKIAINNLCIPIYDVPVLENSETQIRDNCIEWDVPDGIYIHSFDRYTGQTALSKITKKSLHKNIDMFDVVINSTHAHGRIITVSGDGSLIVYENGNYVITQPQNSLGKLVPRINQTKWSKNTYQNRYITLENKIELNHEIGYFIGAMVGDGWIDSNYQTLLASDYDSLKTYIMQVVDNSAIPQNSLSKSFTYYNKTRFGNPNGGKINFHLTRQAATDLQKQIGSGAANKQLPATILSASTDVLVGIFEGLIDTDGTVTYTRAAKGKKTPSKTVGYTTISPILRDQIIEMCARLGIRAKCTPFVIQTSKNIGYRINFSLFDLVNFHKNTQKFNFIHETKQRNFNLIVDNMDTTTPTCSDLDLVPYPLHIPAEMAHIMKEAGINIAKIAKIRRKGYMPRHIAETLVTIIKKLDLDTFTPDLNIINKYKVTHTIDIRKKYLTDWVNLVTNKELKWDKINAVIYKGKMDAWDITVPGPLTFALSNGTVVQDTMALHVPASKDAVQEANELLLPSKTLFDIGNLRTPIHTPSAEFQGGLYVATAAKNKVPPKTFVTLQDMRKAYARGEINLGDPVNILQMDTPPKDMKH